MKRWLMRVARVWKGVDGEEEKRVENNLKSSNG